MPETESEFLGVHHVMIVVPPDKKEDAKHFYEQIIGFVPLENPLESSPSGNLWWYACGRSEFHIALLPEHTVHSRPHAAFHVTNLLALLNRLKRHGIEPRVDYSYKGHWRIYVTDPWNNRTEYIAQLPPNITVGMTAEEAEAALVDPALAAPAGGRR